MDSVRVKGGLLATTFVTGALASSTLVGAPTADASCFSIFGIGNGNGCTSNPLSFAIAIGDGATADARLGFLGGAVALGTNASATTNWTLGTAVTALGEGASAIASYSLFSFLSQLGRGATTVVGGPNLAVGISNGDAQSTSIIGGFNILAHIGSGTASALGGGNLLLGYSGTGAHNVGASGFGNVGIQLGPGSTQIVGGLNLALGASPWGSGAQVTIAGLLGTVALNLFGNGTTSAQGVFGGAVNLFGTSNVEMAGIFSTALNILGNGNTVRVIPQALLSIALGVLSNDASVSAGPGPISLDIALLENAFAVGRAIGSAINDSSAPGTAATQMASYALTNAMSAAAAGDLTTAFSALSALPRNVINAFLHGYDPDGDGPAAALPGLLSKKENGHNGGPIYQLFVGLPASIAAAIENVSSAAAQSGTTAAPESEDAGDGEGTVADDPAADDAVVADPPADDAVVADPAADDTIVDETLTEDTVVDDTLTETAAEDDLEIDDATETPASEDVEAEPAGPSGSGSPGSSADGDKSDDSGSTASSGSGSDSDAGSSSGKHRKGGGKHRAAPRHAA